MASHIIDTPPPSYEHYIKYNNFHDEFRKVAKTHKIKFIYRWQEAEGNTWLGFLYGGLFHVYGIPKGFPTVVEHDQAQREGFLSCSHNQWKQLKGLGYRNGAIVDLDRGDYGVDQWIDIKAQGYHSAASFDRMKGTVINEDNVCEPDDTDYPFHTAIIDGNNISWGDYEEEPKLKNIYCVYEQLRELGVKPYVVVSAALRHHIDDPVGLVEFLKQDDVCEAPADRSDDFFVIQLALRREAFIVSNDRFSDWKRANPDLAGELENRRVALTFIEDDPQFDHKLYTLIKRPRKRKRENSYTNGKTGGNGNGKNGNGKSKAGNGSKSTNDN